jgi:hypothetical protein
LTREVFLPDQSVRIVGAIRIVGKRYFTETLWIFVDDCARNFAQNNASNPSRSGALPSPGPISSTMLFLIASSALFRMEEIQNA